MTTQLKRTIPGLAKAALFTALGTLAMGTAAHAQYVPAVNKTPQARPSTIADLVERISPAVVNIKVTTDDGQTTSEGQGSGFIISPQGEVVTNFHVIEGGTNISVVFNNDITFPAQVMGTDEETDLALLKITSPQPFPHVNFHQGADLRIGDWVIAIGNPFGIGQSTSLGIISAIGRDRVESGAYVDYIQTDATINRGNSGGPLFSPSGQVVGVNSAIYSPTGASVGIAFSIPHHTAASVVQALRTEGRVRRGWLGAGLRTAELSRGNTASPFSSGAIVDQVVSGSPAHLYGLQVDDIIMRINGQAVADSVQATRIIGKFKPGQRVQFDIERAEVNQSVGLQVAERPAKDALERAMAGGSISAAPAYPPAGRPAAPAPAPRSASGSNIGLSVVDLSSTFRRTIGMRHDQVGVYVDQVDAGGLASRHGLEANMVLLEANREPISSVNKFAEILSRARQSRSGQIRLLVKNITNGSEDYVDLPI